VRLIFREGTGRRVKKVIHSKFSGKSQGLQVLGNEISGEGSINFIRECRRSFYFAEKIGLR